MTTFTSGNSFQDAVKSSSLYMLTPPLSYFMVYNIHDIPTNLIRKVRMRNILYYDPSFIPQYVYNIDLKFK